MKNGQPIWVNMDAVDFESDLLIQNWDYEDYNAEQSRMVLKYVASEEKFHLDYIMEDEEAGTVCYHWNPCEEAYTPDETLPAVDKLVNTDVKAVRAKNNAMKEKESKYKKMFRQIDMDLAYERIFDLLWYSNLPCYSSSGTEDYGLIKKCSWKGTNINCSAIFDTFPTDRGMCCTFNMEKAEAIFKESRFQQTVTKFQGHDKNDSNGFPPSWYTKAKEPVSQAGISKGLSLVLDAHTDLLASGSVAEDFQGFFAVVDSMDAYPQAEQKNIRIRPGYDNLVSMSATSVSANENIKSVDPFERYCYFRDEHPLKLTQHYTQASCLLECRIDYVQNYLMEKQNFSCIPW